MIAFEVVGTPAPQGSKTAVMIGNRPGMIEAGDAAARHRHKSWRVAVAHAARVAIGINPPLDGALLLVVTFRFRMPESRSRFLRSVGCTPKATTPDLDKLIRALGDSLKEGGLVHDDSRFAAIRADKVEVWNQWTGATIRIGHLDYAGDEQVLA